MMSKAGYVQGQWKQNQSAGDCLNQFLTDRVLMWLVGKSIFLTRLCLWLTEWTVIWCSALVLLLSVLKKINSVIDLKIIIWELIISEL